jgi:hypothetical protein
MRGAGAAPRIRIGQDGPVNAVGYLLLDTTHRLQVHRMRYRLAQMLVYIIHLPEYIGPPFHQSECRRSIEARLDLRSQCGAAGKPQEESR